MKFVKFDVGVVLVAVVDIFLDPGVVVACAVVIAILFVTFFVAIADADDKLPDAVSVKIDNKFNVNLQIKILKLGFLMLYNSVSF